VVIAAIKHSPSPLLTGTFTVPVETTIEHFLNEHTPEMSEELENIDTALTFLNNAASAFRTTTEKMRDLLAEERAEAGSAAAKQAEAVLQTAMQGVRPATAQPTGE
jgi:demethoxyubiquinone hydroxylase (CLK1/Coq7/Cat5 family)